MKVHVCFVCLKTLDSSQVEKVIVITVPHEINDQPLLNKFLKFIQNYLQINVPLLKSDYGSEANLAFCEKCELSLINPICQIYLELLSVKLRLSWELERQGKLLQNSKQHSSTSHETGDVNTHIPTEEFGLEHVDEMVAFRNLISEKCRLIRQEALPDVLLVSRCDEGNGKERQQLYENHEDDGSPDPLELETLDFQEGENIDEEEETAIDIENVIKLEPLHQHEPEFILGYEDNEAIDDPTNQSRPNSHANSSHILNNKMIMKKEEDFPRKCSKCNIKILNRRQLLVHCRYHHDPINCSFCGKVFHGKKLLHYHVMRSHHKVGRYECPTCSKVFETSIKLKSHRNRYHGASHNCPDCKTRFVSMAGLHRHIAVIHKPESHPCPHCDLKPFRSKEYLRRHIRYMHIIDSSSSYPCEHCSKVFENPRKLAMHTSKYHKVSYTCPHCNAVKSTRGALVQHITAIHTCPHCPEKVFNTKKYLMTHIRSMHPENASKQDLNPIVTYD